MATLIESAELKLSSSDLLQMVPYSRYGRRSPPPRNGKCPDRQRLVGQSVAGARPGCSSNLCKAYWFAHPYDGSLHKKAYCHLRRYTSQLVALGRWMHTLSIECYRNEMKLKPLFKTKGLFGRFVRFSFAYSQRSVDSTRAYDLHHVFP